MEGGGGVLIEKASDESIRVQLGRIFRAGSPGGFSRVRRFGCEEDFGIKKVFGSKKDSGVEGRFFL